MLAGTYYKEETGTTLQSYTSGYTLSNISILGAVNISGQDSFNALATASPKGFDMCLGSSEPATATNSGGVTQTNSPGVWNYKTMSSCMVSPPIYNPMLCTDPLGALTECSKFPFEWMKVGWPTTANYGGIIGLARDGHVIVGPYNAQGELWACD